MNHEGTKRDRFIVRSKKGKVLADVSGKNVIKLLEFLAFINEHANWPVPWGSCSYLVKELASKAERLAGEVRA